MICMNFESSFDLLFGFALVLLLFFRWSDDDVEKLITKSSFTNWHFCFCRFDRDSFLRWNVFMVNFLNVPYV